MPDMLINENEEQTWLREFIATGSQPAFTRLARRYIDLVYSAAKRQSSGDAHAAEDITQAVFLVLAQRAKTIPLDRPLSAWLLNVTRYCAANARRARSRRQIYERKAAAMIPITHNDPANWDALAPLLDEGMQTLAVSDRDALTLRFMEQKTLRQIGDMLGISEDAAQKRIHRAVERLRAFFHRRGFATASAATLAVFMANRSLEAAPPALLTHVATTAAAAPAAALAKGAVMAMTVHKTAAVTAIALLLLLGSGAIVLMVRSTASAPRGQPTFLQTAPAVKGDSATFSDGTTVRILGMTEIPSAGMSGIASDAMNYFGLTKPQSKPQSTPWWTADGSPRSPLNLTGFAMFSVGDQPGRRNLRFIFATTSPTHRAGSLSINIPGSSSFGESAMHIDNETRTNFVVSLPNTLNTTTIKLARAAGPWRDDITAPINTPQTSKFVTSSPTTPLVSGSVHEANGKFVIETRGDDPMAADRDSCVVAVLNDGTDVYCTECQGLPDGRNRQVFPAPLAKVSKIVWRSRPQEWRTIQSVALNPAATPTTRPGSK
ncbi:MAG TPA: sigma-70 family RNA polymerase sigma factor [Tepidisphaeraceae bacterium]|jgi:RNA polymerase sigma factor (sigma-70 family)|nr:sigma-70 family RNA polymerase sigma factor [Tepidisphaeraceae bacterium]